MVVGYVGSDQRTKVDKVDEIVGEMKNLDVVGLVGDAVYKVDAVPEESHVVG